MIQEIRYNEISKIYYTEYEYDRIDKPVSAKVSIFSQSEEIVLSQDCDIDADGNISYSFDASGISLQFLTAEFVLVYGIGVDAPTRKRNVLIRIVMTPLVNIIITQDVIEEALFLKDKNFRKIGQAESGDITTISDSTLLEPHYWWISGLIEITEGTNAGQSRKIDRYNHGTINVIPAFSSAIDNTSKYILTKSYHHEIARAFEDVLEDIGGIKGRESAIIDSSQIKTLIIFKAIEKICMNFAKEEADIWWVRYGEYKNNYEKKMARIKIYIDANQSGVIGTDEINDGISQIQAER